MADSILIIISFIFGLGLGIVATTFAFYNNTETLMAIIETTKNKNKIKSNNSTIKLDLTNISDIGYKCTKCNKYYESSDPKTNNMTSAMNCCHQGSIIYYICKTCGARWKTENEKNNCKHK